MANTKSTDAPSQQSAAADRFALDRGHQELPKDNVPLRRGDAANGAKTAGNNRLSQDRKAEVARFKQRLAAQSGDRDKLGFAHTQDVAAKQREVRSGRAAERFGAKTVEQSQTPSQTPSQGQPQQAAAQRFQNAQSQTPSQTPAPSQGQAMSR